MSDALLVLRWIAYGAIAGVAIYSVDLFQTGQMNRFLELAIQIGVPLVGKLAFCGGVVGISRAWLRSRAKNSN